ncbi:MAG: hypothetical protein ACREGH_03235 [Minisyncoccia bacterium]
MKKISIAIILSLSAMPFAAFAQTIAVPVISTNASASINAKVGSTSVSVHANVKAAGILSRINTAKARADQEITRRIGNLTKVATRINAAAHISASDKSDLSSSIASQISALQALQTQVANDTSTSSLRVNIQSITKSYRIYMLVIPQAGISAGADRVNYVISMMQSLITKIQARLAVTPNAAASSALADMQTKITSATTLSSVAVSEIVALKPDNGNKTIEQSNIAVLKDARGKIEAAQQDLLAARKDVTTILHELKAGGSASASASASTSTQ